MIYLPFGFSVYRKTILEITINKKSEPLSKYILISKGNGEPIYAKFDLNNNLKELYPYFINDDISSSLEELKKDSPYKGMDLNEIPYMSYDLINCPEEIYIKEDIPIIHKYRFSELETTYYLFFSYKEFLKDERSSNFDFKDKFPKPDYVILQDKKGFENIILLGYLKGKRNYKKIKKEFFSNFFK